RQGAAEEERPLEVAGQQIVPLAFGNLGEGCGVEGGRVVHQAVDATPVCPRALGEFRHLGKIRQIGAEGNGGAGSPLIEGARQRSGGVGGATVMDHQVVAGVVQGGGNGGAQATGGTGDQGDGAARRLSCRGCRAHRNGRAGTPSGGGFPLPGG